MKAQKKIVLGAFVFLSTLVSFSAGSFADDSQAAGGGESWKGYIFAGYNQTNGNTKKGSANLEAEATKKLSWSEIKLKGTMSYSETNRNMDGQKWDALAKHTFDFGEAKRWFSFQQVYADHDYFSDIDYRITPSAGLGYHIIVREDLVWDADAGVGYRITRHRINKAADDEAITALVHSFCKKQVFAKAWLSEDVTVYPSLKDGSDLVLKSETAFTNPLTEKLDFQIKYIIDYASQPAEGKKKTDTQLVIGLKYSF